MPLNSLTFNMVLFSVLRHPADLKMNIAFWSNLGGGLMDGFKTCALSFCYNEGLDLNQRDTPQRAVI